MKRPSGKQSGFGPERILYVLVFAGLGGATLHAVAPACRQLAGFAFAEFHPAAPVHLPWLVAGALSLAALVDVGIRLLRQKSVPLRTSIALLLAAAMGLNARPAEARIWVSANAQIERSARALHRLMLQRLQLEGEVPKSAGAWSAVLRDAAGDASPVSKRLFRPIPYQVWMQQERAAAPVALLPATFLIWVSEDQASFELTPVGFADNATARLLPDARGETLVLTGSYQPSLEGESPVNGL